MGSTIQKYNSIAIERNATLVKSQRMMYSLICEKIKNKERLRLLEVRDIWLNYSHKDTRNGVPYYFNWWWRDETDKMVGRYEPMNEEQITIAMTMFLTNTIGRLVLKGYLRVIPELELN